MQRLIDIDTFVGMANEPDPKQVGSRWSQNIEFGPGGTWIRTRPGTEHLTRGERAVQPQADGTTFQQQVYRLKDERIEQVVLVAATSDPDDGVHGPCCILPVRFAPLTAIGLGDDGIGSGIYITWQDDSATPVVDPPRDLPIDFTSTGPLASLAPFWEFTVKVFVQNLTASTLTWTGTPITFSGTNLSMATPAAPSNIAPGDTEEISITFQSGGAAGLGYGTISFNFTGPVTATAEIGSTVRTCG